MMDRRRCDDDRLERLALGGLGAELSARVEEHVGDCPRCRDELAWLRAESELMRRRPARSEPLPAELWSAVERRVAEESRARAAGPPGVDLRGESPRPDRSFPARRGPVGLMAALVAGVVAASALGGAALHHARQRTDRTPALAVPGPERARPMRPDDTPRVLAEAEQQYRETVVMLEAEYAAGRARLGAAARRHDAALAATRAGLGEARDQIDEEDQEDVEARLRLLDGYAEYVYALQTAVEDIEVK